MCGGAGTRLWPLSRPSSPKQFLPLVGERSLFQATVSRCQALDGFHHLIVVTGQKHGTWVNDQLGAVASNATVLLEPEARDSAAAMAAAALWVEKHHPGSVAVFVASDHFIPSDRDFADAVGDTLAAAKEGMIVTLGVRPDYSASAYGYIRPKEDVVGGVPRVHSFVEKPSQKVAALYIAEGYLWNSGNFVTLPSKLISELGQFAPDVVRAASDGVDEATDGAFGYALGASFCASPKISIDYAVMEKTKDACVLPVSFQWSDLGAWDAIKRVQNGDNNGNVASGPTVLRNTQNSYLRAEDGMVIAATGVEGLAIVADKDAVLVCPLDQVQSVKDLANEVKERGLPQADRTGGVPAKTLDGYAQNLCDWLMVSAAPLWATLGVETEQDGQALWFRETLDITAKPTGAALRMRVQARQSYAFALLGKLGWHGPWASTAAIGLHALDTRFAKPDGYYRTGVDGITGVPSDETSVTYDQAFVLLALSVMNADAQAEPKALALLDLLLKDRKESPGALRDVGPHPRLSNPNMHFFEALIAWRQVGQSPLWAQLCDEIAMLAIERMIDGQTGAMPEILDKTWQPSATSLRIEPGHQFEWAWLLFKWSMLSGNQEAISAAKRLFAVGRLGVDTDRMVAMNALDGAFAPQDANARFWPQTEWLKASLALAQLSTGAQKAMYESEALHACAAIDSFIQTPVQGLWFDELTKDGAMKATQVPASTFYHIVVAIQELLASTAAGSHE